jgi:hypothetical protein
MSEKPFCEICGLFEIEHPVPKPGPPQPPPLDRPEGEVWRPPHEFTPSRFTLPELLDERDAQIHHWRRRTYKLHHRLNAVRIALGVPQRPAPEGGDTEREAVWLCAKCGRGSEEHAAGGPSEDCVADMRLRPVAPAPRGAEQERLVDLTHALATDFKDGERLTDRQREEIARQAWNIAVDLSEHGAEGDEEPSCQPPGAEQLRPPDQTEEALRKRIAEADEQINRLHATLTEARRRADDAAGWVVEHEAELEHQHALRETAEQKATELAALAYHPYQCSCGKGPHGKGAGIMGSDAPEAGPDCRPLTWKEVAERASESATARRKEGRDIFRQLRSAEALAQRRGEALERIAKWPCHNSDTGDEPECPDLDIQDFRWCPPCDARSVLENDRG